MEILALDFGGSSLKYGLMTEKGILTHTGSAPAPLKDEAEFQDLVEQVYRGMPGTVDGIAVSLPGYIDSERCVLLGSGAYENLHRKNIRTLLEDRLGEVRVSVQNDGKCAALAEAWIGELKDVKDGIVIILGTGVAGGILKQGELLARKISTAGEFSYYSCGSTDGSMANTLAMHSSAAGIAAKMCVRKNLDTGVQDAPDLVAMLAEIWRKKNGIPEPSGAPAKVKVDGKEFFRMLDAGDADAADVYREFIDGLVQFVYNLQIIYSPEKIALGGGLCRDKRIVRDVRAGIDRVHNALAAYGVTRCTIVPCRMMSDTNLYGAAYQYLQKFGKER